MTFDPKNATEDDAYAFLAKHLRRETVTPEQRQTRSNPILGMPYGTNETACAAIIAPGIVCGERKSAHTQSAAKADVSLDHVYVEGTWDAE